MGRWSDDMAQCLDGSLNHKSSHTHLVRKAILADFCAEIDPSKQPTACEKKLSSLVLSGWERLIGPEHTSCKRGMSASQRVGISLGAEGAMLTLVSRPSLAGVFSQRVYVGAYECST